MGELRKGVASVGLAGGAVDAARLSPYVGGRRTAWEELGCACGLGSGARSDGTVALVSADFESSRIPASSVVVSGEVVLSGGRMTRGVVRVGDTVRRPASGVGGVVLRHLEQQGFVGAPRWLGVDGAGRDVLSYLPGWVPEKFRTWTDAQVGAAGALARELHDATRGSGLAGSHQVVCHHDLGPNNAVFQYDLPVAFIDFDLAAPGSPLEDVGYMAWLWCVSSKAGAPSVEAQARQVRVLADGYGLAEGERSVLVDAMLERQSRNARFWGELPAGSVDATREQIAERIAWSRREHAYTTKHRDAFAAALT
ncbi:aminoglycoside phosphotransferase family protein [Kribbella sp. DT2]|uniref:aminoglycoside phosphotransferase family protein n=1 Tax=Kribbella sp. DT2 TaxID=3393427 RepID=UPI003CF8E47D